MIFETIRDLLQFLGIFVICIAAIGLFRLPDVYCRSHAIGKSLTLGIALQLIALLMTVDTNQQKLIVLFTLVFQFLTIPTAAHLVCQMARRQGIQGYKRPIDINESNS